MAEMILSPVIEKLIELLAKEVNLLKGVHREVKTLKDELEIIQPFLRDAEAKLDNGQLSDATKVWLRQIREEADRIEDVIDEYRHYLAMKHHRHEHRFINSLRRACYLFESMKLRDKLASDIRDIRRSLCEIKDRGQGYGLRPLEQGSSSMTSDVEANYNPRLGSLFIEEDELVGIQSTSKELIKSLVEGQSARLVISVAGEGGIGKTTLANKVYDNDVVKQHFGPAHAWITVSQSFNLKNLLKKIKEKIIFSTRQYCNWEEIETIEELIDSLRNYLQTKRYMVVFDDVWQKDFWEVIKLAFPNNDEGSRIIITTRSVAVANYCKETPYDFVYNLQPWPPTLAWELFCKKAFRYEFQGNCPEELKKLSIEIVSKCQGLPLVVATIASLLATKEKIHFEWQRMLDDLSSKVEPNSQLTKISKILSLSYYDLPSPLRSCFLYFGVFPEDSPIYDDRLYRLWIAEGFIKAGGGKTGEEIAKEYLNELVERNLVIRDPWQPVGEGSRFRVHDLMRDIILTRADEVCFRQTCDEKNSQSRGKGRRLTIYSGVNVLKNVESSGVRSIFFSDINDPLTNAFTVSLFKKFKLLDVLDFENAPLDSLPKELGNLFCLKYLSLKCTNVKELPKSISKLYNLQSLDIRDTLIRELPNDINELQNLRHLLAYSFNHSSTTHFDCVHGVKIQQGIGGLEDLQTLTLVEAQLGPVGQMKELEKLKKLQWLAISKLTKEIGMAVCASIGKMDHLERLCLSSTDENEVLDLQYISSPPHFLRELVLTGRLDKLPGWILELQNLRGLSLALSRLIDEPIKCLKGLTNLESLQFFDNAYEGEKLHFEKGGFPKLKRLLLYSLNTLKVVKIDRGALPLLEQLGIANCLLLSEMPSINHLGNIKYAVVNGRHLSTELKDVISCNYKMEARKIEKLSMYQASVYQELEG